MRLRRFVAAAGIAAAAHFAIGQSVSTYSQQSFTPPTYTHYPDHPEVAAFYYAWYEGNWGALLDMMPLLGEYDSSEPAVISQHMQWAVQAGLDDLIISWWGTAPGMGQNVDSAVPAIMSAAAANGLHTPFMIDAYSGRTPASVVNDIAYLISEYSASPAWYTNSRPTPFLTTSSARPVFLVYMSETDTTWKPSDWTSALDQIHQNSNAVVLIHNTYDPTWVTTGHFDGMFSYGNESIPAVRDLAQDLPANAWYLPSAFPGFNAYRSKGWTNIIPRLGGKTYDRSWNETLDLGIDMPIISVTSFNEWTETTQIEPCQHSENIGGFITESYGSLGPYGYLNKTASWASIAKAFQPYDFTDASTLYSQPGSPSTNMGLWQTPWGTLAQTSVTTVDGEPAVVCNIGSYMWEISLEHGYCPTTAGSYTIRVDYFDGLAGEFRLAYDSALTQSAHNYTPYVHLTGTGQWRTAIFQVPNALFANQFGGSTDFRVEELVGNAIALGLVVVTKNA